MFKILKKQVAMKKLPKKFNSVTFLNVSEEDPNRHARIEWLGEGINQYKICNANMPYLGSLNYLITRTELKKLLTEGKVKLQ